MKDEWDVIVVGAGPAGSMAALQVARSGAAVLVVERSEFPRTKVCGSCLGPATSSALAAAGLGRLLADAGAIAYRRLRLSCAGRSVELAVPAGAVLSRAVLDQRLLQAAETAGAVALTRTVAQLLPCADPAAGWRELHLRQGASSQSVRARVVLACDGLGSGLLRDEPAGKAVVAPRAPVGAGAIIERERQDGSELFRLVQVGTIHMTCGRGGYVGMVRLEQGDLDLAAALRPGFLRAMGSPALAVQSILTEAGVPPVPAIEQLRWRGTPSLTRRLCMPGGHRVLAVGDSAGYVEPFTGDGIAWALSGAQCVAPLALAAVREWDPALPRTWQARHHALVAARQGICRRVGWWLGHPRLTRLAVRTLAMIPQLAQPILDRLARPLCTPVNPEGLGSCPH